MYYKILNKDMRHYDMRYKEGLNVNCEETIYDGICESGLFFANENHILEFCDYGDLIADVTLPEGEQIFEYDNKYKAHRIILSNIRPLWTAETFQYLLTQGANIHFWDDYVLGCASEYGHLEIAKFLVNQGADIHAKDDYALRCAAENGCLDIVKFLAENGANIHSSDDYALKYATQNGHFEIAKYLKSIA